MAYQQGTIPAMYAARQQQEALKQRSAASSFLSRMLSTSSESGGEFEIINDRPVWNEGVGAPSKSALWNQYVQLLGGQLNHEDVRNFEDSYKQAKLNRRSRKMEQIQKLQLRGYSDNNIKDIIEETPALYENLIDLITDLKSSGDPQAIEQAMAVESYLPGREERGLLGDIAAGEGGALGDYILPAAVFGAPSAIQYARGRGQEAVKTAADEYRTSRRAATADIKDADKKYKSKVQEVKDKAKAIKDKKGKLKHPKKSKPLQQMIKDKRALSKEQKTLKTQVDDLTKKRSDIKIKDPGSRWSRMKAKGYKPGVGTAMATSYFAPEIGEYLGGEEARQPASVLANLGLLGYGIMRRDPATAITGGIGLGMQGYDYFFGDE